MHYSRHPQPSSAHQRAGAQKGAGTPGAEPRTADTSRSAPGNRPHRPGGVIGPEPHAEPCTTGPGSTSRDTADDWSFLIERIADAVRRFDRGVPDYHAHAWWFGRGARARRLPGASSVVAVDPLVPRSIEVYVCPVCGTHDLDEHYTGGHDFDRYPDCHRNQRVPVRYVPAEVTDEMVEHIATLIAERFGGWDFEHDRWEDDATRTREMDWARGLLAEVVGFGTQEDARNAEMWVDDPSAPAPPTNAEVADALSTEAPDA